MERGEEEGAMQDVRHQGVWWLHLHERALRSSKGVQGAHPEAGREMQGVRSARVAVGYGWGSALLVPRAGSSRHFSIDVFAQQFQVH